MATIKTNLYTNTHGTAPKGEGSWAFINESNQEIVFAPSCLTLSRAKAWLNSHVMPGYSRLIRSQVTWQVAP